MQVLQHAKMRVSERNQDMEKYYYAVLILFYMTCLQSKIVISFYFFVVVSSLSSLLSIIVMPYLSDLTFCVLRLVLPSLEEATADDQSHVCSVKQQQS